MAVFTANAVLEKYEYLMLNEKQAHLPARFSPRLRERLKSNLKLWSLAACICLVARGEAYAARLSVVADINPFPGDGTFNGSYPSNMTVYGDALYFAANDGTHGKELWKWDGTSAALVADIVPGAGWSQPQDFVVLNNTLYFTVFHPDVDRGRELWKLSGNQPVRLTSIDTVPINPWAGGRAQVATFQNGLVFIGFNGFGSHDLWNWNGSSAERLTNFYAQTGNTEMVVSIYPFKDDLFIATADDYWIWNGNEAVRLDNFPSRAVTEDVAAINDRLFFSGEAPGFGGELFIWDGDNVPTMVDVRPGINSSGPAEFIVFRDDIYFVATDDAHGRELWKRNGHEATIAADIRPGPDSSNIQWLTVFDDAIYFAAYTEEFGRELWSFNGQHAKLVADVGVINTLTAPLNHLTVYNGSLYFSHTDDRGTELWRLELVPEPTGLLLSITGAAISFAVSPRRMCRREAINASGNRPLFPVAPTSTAAFLDAPSHSTRLTADLAVSIKGVPWANSIGGISCNRRHYSWPVRTPAGRSAIRMPSRDSRKCPHSIPRRCS
jgi:ELWxxDGT repeat protein